MGETGPVRATTIAPSPLFVLLVTATVAGGALAALTTGVARTGGIVLLVLSGWAVSLCLHEFGHAIVAYRGGDRSVRAKGYLTLDIRRYTDPVLSLLLPLLLLAAGGIPLPGGAVWINHSALRSRAIVSTVSLAGPLTNLALGAVLIAVVGTGTLSDGLTAGLSYLALVQVLAFVLNILPVPGLDGFGVLEPYLSAPARRFAATVRPYAPLLLFVLIIGVPAVAWALFDASFTVFDALGGNPAAAGAGLDEFLFWR
ncbi:MAG: site-2 protease family protein [Pseudonocardiaceae bacterium]